MVDLTIKLENVMLRHSEMHRVLRVLRSLTFPEIWDRQLSISDTYGETGHWMYDAQRTPFHKWLSTGRGIFWISGKAGSGKSTLMRLLAHHPRTFETLQNVSTNPPVTVASFYFWNSGTEKQKSQDGLLQSLLFQILRQCPDLIPAACPKRWASDEIDVNGTSTTMILANGTGLDLAGQSELHDPWTRQELRQTLTTILNQSSMTRRFCFFIDGLDEYHGEHYALIDDLKAFVKSPRLMLCVSSRPWNAFQDAFGNDKNAYIVLENETQDDMEIYVNGTLREHQLFSTLLKEGTEAQELVTEVRKRSHGIFLWVFLAVRSLLRGFTEHDEIATLHERLQQLPPELERLFGSVLESVDPVYKRHQAQAILLVTHTLETLPTLMFWFLQKLVQDPGYVFNMEIGWTTNEDLKKMQDEARIRINSWCRDLFEVQKRRRPRKADGLAHQSDEPAGPLADLDDAYQYRVVFLHLSVRDYLMTKDVQEDLQEQAGHDFSPYETLCHLHLATVPLETERGNELFMRHMRELELRTSNVPIGLLERLDYVSTKVHEMQRGKTGAVLADYEDASSSDGTSSIQSEEPQVDQGRLIHWTNYSCSTHLYNFESDFLAFTITHGIKGYLAAVLAADPSVLKRSDTPHLYFAFQRRDGLDFSQDMWGMEYGEAYNFQDDPPLPIIRLLLENGADPDQMLTIDCESRGMATVEENPVQRTVLEDYQMRHRDGERVIAVTDLVARVQAERVALTRTKEPQYSANELLLIRQLHEQNRNLKAKLADMGVDLSQVQGQMTDSRSTSSNGLGARSTSNIATAEASHAIAEKIPSRDHQTAVMDYHQKTSAFAITTAYSIDGMPLEPLNPFSISDHHHSNGLQVQDGIESQLLPHPDSFDIDFDQLLDLEQNHLPSQPWQESQPD